MRFVFVLLVLPISLLCFDIKHHCGEYSGYQPLPDEFIDKSTHSTTNLDRCELIQMQYISRHGERFPFGGMVGKFERIHQKFQSLPSNADIPDFIKSWTPALFTYQSVFEDATAKGLNELYELAKRIKYNNPKIARLLDWESFANYSQEHPVTRYKDLSYWNSNFYRFESSQFIHTARSAEAFAYGLFESNGLIGNNHSFLPFYVESTSEVTKRLTSYNEIKKCPAVMDYFSSLKEPDIIKNSLLSPIAEKLNAKWKDLNVTVSDVSGMFEICAFEANLIQETKKFCSLFSEDDFRAFEKMKDFQTYYEDSYGFVPAVLASSLLLQEIYAYMDKALHDPENAQRIVVRFAHHQTVATLTSLMV